MSCSKGLGLGVMHVGGSKQQCSKQTKTLDEVHLQKVGLREGSRRKVEDVAPHTLETILPVNRSTSATPFSAGESAPAAAVQLYPTMACPRLCGSVQIAVNASTSA